MEGELVILVDSDLKLCEINGVLESLFSTKNKVQPFNNEAKFLALIGGLHAE